MFTPILVTYPGSFDDSHEQADVHGHGHSREPGSGAIRRVAEEIALTLRGEGLETEMHDLHALPPLAPYRSVVLGAPFVTGSWQGATRAFISRSRDALIALPVAVFALAPENPDPIESGSRRELLEELARYRWLHPIAAEVFRLESAAVTGNGNGAGAGPVDHEVVRAWAHLVARLLIPAPAR